jgi:rare lipoprotein A
MKQASLTVLAVSLLAFSSAAQAQTGLASYYGGRGHGMTCAHRTKPMGSIVTVRTRSGRSIQCVVNDRGPFVRGRIIDVSVSAARALGMMGAGVVAVSVE